MASISIAEFSDMGRSASGTQAQVAQTPVLTKQSVTFSTEAKSAPFGSETRLVRVCPTAPCFVAFGPNPTATSADMLMTGTVAEYFGVVPGHRLSVISLAAA